MNVKCDSLKLEVVFDFQECKCSITDKERNINDEYISCELFMGKISKVQDITDFNHFIGDCVYMFLEDNGYSVDDECEEYLE